MNTSNDAFRVSYIYKQKQNHRKIQNDRKILW